jgi:N-acetyl sugar amidotransferase
MDTTDQDIFFNEKGICNHCTEYFSLLKEHELDRSKSIDLLVEEISQKGKNKKYDCIIGLSGGVDSTYVAYKVKELGLRPLAVHLDNGWDSELAVSNIENTVNKLGIDLYTHVIDWEEFKDLQLSYFKASVIDIEVLTDHAIWAILYRMAYKYNIKYLINGSNLATESILPLSWISDKNDLKNIKAIHKRFGSRPIKTFPTLGLLKKLYFENIKRIKVVLILNYLKYDKSKAMDIIKSELDWKEYRGKHHESTFTKFFQSYILPEKFNIDKRKAHLSALICSKQITREKALQELDLPLYSQSELKAEKDYVLKKLSLTEYEFEDIMQKPVKSFKDYPSYHNSLPYKAARKLYRFYKYNKGTVD